ncbi:MAG: WcbI family polysaccharide biosynthesis putative acetyltransferase [Paraglaciecola sp.]|uniref:WcbI family polysaccharide biosynthesis putative acetyltransferase n=1 Tax=Paraglaciecola sp. TaxID=1920173 RepID=UPI003297ED39
MKIVVVGNCQARPLAQLLSKLNPNITITATPIVHLLKASDEVEYRPALDDADLIITQLIGDSYPCEFIRTSQLKTRYSDKVKTILNLYFTGYNPDLRYLRHPEVGTLRGPIGDYHNQTVLTGWMLGISQQQVCNWLRDPFFNQREYATASIQSIHELKTRESHIDIPVVDYIETNYKQQRLFFTYNHPAAIVLVEYARRISIKLLSHTPKISADLTKNEYLAQLIPAVPPGLGLNLAPMPLTKGQAVVNINGPKIELGVETHYKDKELVALFYQIYSENAEFTREKYDT